MHDLRATLHAAAPSTKERGALRKRDAFQGCNIRARGTNPGVAVRSCRYELRRGPSIAIFEWLVKIANRDAFRGCNIGLVTEIFRSRRDPGFNI